MNFDIEGLAKSHFAIGAVGALITAVKFTPGASWGERAFNVLAGAALLFSLVGMSLSAAIKQARASAKYILDKKTRDRIEAALRQPRQTPPAKPAF